MIVTVALSTLFVVLRLRKRRKKRPRKKKYEREETGELTEEEDNNERIVLGVNGNVDNIDKEKFRMIKKDENKLMEKAKAKAKAKEGDKHEKDN